MYLVILLLTSFSLFSCGPLRVEHTVSGDVYGHIDVRPVLFLPFATEDCLTRVPGNLCYDIDPLLCASCLSNLIYESLGIK